MTVPETPDNENPPISARLTEDGIPMMANGQMLSAVQIQALREARTRKAHIDARHSADERGGARRSKEATRYGDWEIAGRAVDFS